MTINQHNYEEFFLLYADGELSAEDQQAVEQFVQANPGLAEELEILQQLQLPGEDLVFPGKDLLYRDGNSGITPENYETQFLLYVDKELDSAAKESVETFVLQHPKLQDAFTMLKQTRLEPETITFPDKQSLYRKEEKERRVFYIGWQRVAVAAALIGFVVFAWTLYPSGNNIPPATLARQELPVNSNHPNIAGAGKDVATGTGVAEQEAVNPIAVTNAAKPVAVPGRRTSPESKAEPLTTGGLLTNNMETSSPALPFEKENTVTERTGEIQVSRPTAALPASRNSLTAADMVKAKNNIDENTTVAALTQPAVYKELDTDDEKKSLYLGSIEINKDKLRGFFRKAGSIFRSKARQQEEERSESTPVNTRSLK